MKLNSDWLLFATLALFWLLINFQMLSVFGWINDTKGVNIKLYHLFSLVFLPFILKQPLKFKLSKTGLILVFLFMIIVFLTSITLSPFYGFNSVFINYFFAFYVFFLGYFLSKRLNSFKILKIFQSIIILIYIVVLIKSIYYYETITYFLKNPYGHPSIYYIYGGGPNLEATWITLCSLFFLNRKRLFYFSILFSFIISAIYASRISIIMVVLVYIFYFVSNRPTKNERRIILSFFVISSLTFGYYIIHKLSDLYVIERFLNIGDKVEGGSQGRLMLYNAFAESFTYKSMFGVGSGNAIPYIERTLNLSFREDNLHNYYLQVLLEFGIIGLLIFLLIVIDLVKKNIQLKFSNPFGLFVLCYLIGCLIQFRGAEVMFWFCLGLFYGTYYLNDKSQRKLNNET